MPTEDAIRVAIQQEPETARTATVIAQFSS